MSNTLTAAEQKAAKIRIAEKNLHDARREFEAHVKACPGDHFWAYGCKSREHARRLWLLKKERLEGHVLTAQSELKTAQSLWIVGWEPVQFEKPVHYDARRSTRLKGNAA